MAFANAPGARLYYESVGSGTPIVFVHETNADMRSWEDQLAAVASCSTSRRR
jgi:pimeloyl-ACP methyl ester carboxylesterase